MITRREFCVGALAFSTVGVIGCKERVPVLKVPEDADECFDLFRFFSDPAFGLEQARAGLGVTGEPEVDVFDWRKLFKFANQSGIVESITFETGADGRPDANKLTTIYIDYRTPIEVSLRRLESYLGRSSIRNKKIAAKLDAPFAMFTNLKPGQKEREISSYSFFPDQPIAPGYLKAELWFQCDTIFWDTKRMDRLRYQRRVNGE